MKIEFNPELTEVAREMRENSSLAEILLWNELKARKLKGFQFFRHKPVGDCIVDFYCNRLRLAIEIDGIDRDMAYKVDADQQKTLESKGVNFLRFDALLIKRNTEAAVEKIAAYIEEFEGN
ncbi:endonuclease domain-containing protein [Marinoscillum furvescens]|uniref:Very-short-patch-repair endonuclease n=1 Tax=Marinoscillum furvescens DSM 4134 TaxID=1122208 RepID=A0A3D9L5J6_MARFU|nr:DUF559 domain-containing protein [Marinoscillum furvescens]RED98873.1 very-short-patch-repair endonuclease [Marinoscillum furvescens DSM 4134]